MKKETHLHLWHYFILGSVLLAGLLLFFFFQGNPNKQFLVIIMTSFLYLLWGIMHHYAEGSLHPKIMLEYLLVALLAVFLAKGALLK